MFSPFQQPSKDNYQKLTKGKLTNIQTRNNVEIVTKINIEVSHKLDSQKVLSHEEQIADDKDDEFDVLSSVWTFRENMSFSYFPAEKRLIFENVDSAKLACVRSQECSGMRIKLVVKIGYMAI